MSLPLFLSFPGQYESNHGSDRQHSLWDPRPVAPRCACPLLHHLRSYQKWPGLKDAGHGRKRSGHGNDCCKFRSMRPSDGRHCHEFPLLPYSNYLVLSDFIHKPSLFLLFYSQKMSAGFKHLTETELVSDPNLLIPFIEGTTGSIASIIHVRDYEFVQM